MSTTSLQYLSLFLSPNKTYQVRIYRGAAAIWQGWVNPEYYTEPLMPAPYATKISVTDGLALLKNIELPPPAYTMSDLKQSAIYYIAACLSEIELDSEMIIKASIDLAADTTGGYVNERMLEELYFDYRTFEDMTCYDILDTILSSLNARLFQFGDAWWIERVDQKYTDYDVDIYSMGGMYASTQSVNQVYSLTAHTGRGTDVRFVNTPAQLEVQPAYKGYEMEQDYGERENLLDGISYILFKAYDWISSTSLRFWNVTGTVDYVREVTLQALRIRGLYTSGSNYLSSNTISLTAQGAGTLDELMAAWQLGEVSLKFSFDVMKQFQARR